MSGWWAGGDTSEESTPVFGKPEAPGLPYTPARRGYSCGREGSWAEGRGPLEVLPDPQHRAGPQHTGGALGPFPSLRRPGQPWEASRGMEGAQELQRWLHTEAA